MEKDYMVKRMERLLKEEKEKLLDEVKSNTEKSMSKPEPEINFRIKRR